MTTQQPYRVKVTREGSAWLAEIDGLDGAHTFARTLSGLDRSAREVIVLAADLPDTALPQLELHYQFHTGDAELDDAAAEIRAVRSQAEQLAADAQRRTADAARRLTARGLSVRDTAIVLGISPQRVSQLVDAEHVS